MENLSLPGVYLTYKKDKTPYYKASITYRNKHISLGSFDVDTDAHQAYLEADRLLKSPDITLDDYADKYHLSFEKWVILCNFRDNGVYISNPVYIRPKLVYYYFAPHDFYIFSGEDLFYYSAHKIQRRGGHLFVADYSSQISLYTRYGIKSHAVPGKDFVFLNGNPQDWQYSNIRIINSYHGVTVNNDNVVPTYTAKIHVNGYLKIGVYSSAVEAAIAYNKAADMLKMAGVNKQYAINYIDGLSPKSYADIYSCVKISDSVQNYGVNI